MVDPRIFKQTTLPGLAAIAREMPWHLMGQAGLTRASYGLMRSFVNEIRKRDEQDLNRHFADTESVVYLTNLPLLTYHYYLNQGGLGFEFCVFVAGWRHALRSEWPFIIII